MGTRADGLGLLFEQTPIPASTVGSCSSGSYSIIISEIRLIYDLIFLNSGGVYNDISETELWVSGAGVCLAGLNFLRSIIVVQIVFWSAGAITCRSG